MNITATAAVPTTGQIATVFNLDHATAGGENLNGASTIAHGSGVSGVAVAADGTIYFCDRNNHKVKKITPQGVVVLVAGSGTNGFLGDNGPATAARLSSPNDVALDDVGQILYVSDLGNDRIRKIDLVSGVISTYAGTGTTGTQNAPFGDGGQATAAEIEQPSLIELAPNRDLWLVDDGNERLRKIDRTTGVITTMVTQTNGNTCGGTANITNFYTSGEGIAFDAAGRVFFMAQGCGTFTGNNYGGVLYRLENDLSVTYLGGNALGGTADGISVRTSKLDGASLAIDAGGNIYLADNLNHRIRRIDGSTGIVTTVIGVHNSSGSASEHTAAGGQRVSSPFAPVFVGNDLLFSDNANHSIRRIYGVGNATPTPLTLTLQSGNNQTTQLSRNAANTLAVRVQSGGVDLSGVTTDWDVVTAGGALTGSPAPTVGGVAQVTVRAGLAAGMYQFRAHFRDLHGNEATGSPVTFNLTAVAPADDQIYTVLNVNRGSGFSGMDEAATTANVGAIRAVTTAPDGRIFVADANRIYQISTAGVVTHIAGTGTGSFNFDFGPATAVHLNNITGLAYEASKDRLYLTDQTNDRVRGISLADGSLFRVAGGGTAPAPGFGDGGGGTTAVLSSPMGLAMSPTDGKLYVFDVGHDRIRRIDTNSFIIELATQNNISGPCTTAAVNFSQASTGWGALASDASGNMYFSANFCGTSVGPSGNNAWGVGRWNQADGTITHIMGHYVTGADSSEGAAATLYHTNGGQIRGLTVDGTTLYLLLGDSSNSNTRIKRINLAGLAMTTFGFTGVEGFSGEYGPVSAAQGGSMTSIHAAFNHLYVADQDNVCLRVIQ